MIEINLVPDVKQELLRANKVRASVISLSIIIAIAALAAVVIVSLYVFAGQTLRGSLLDGSTKDEFGKLEKAQDLGKALTVQQQVASIAAIHGNTSVDSRLFDVLTTVVPKGTTVSNFALDTESKTITIEGETAGYNDLDALKKTILATKFVYQQKGESVTSPTQSVLLASQVNDGDRSLGQDQDDRPVLRFSISFEYPDELFSRESVNGQIVAPSKTNATDSKLAIPASLFSSTSGGTE